MTTRVQIKVEKTNAPTGRMIVGVVQGTQRSTSILQPPFDLEYWVAGEQRVIVREASAQDVLDHTVGTAT